MVPMNNNTGDHVETDLPRGLKILLCEDCFDQGRMLLKVLETIGAEVTLECNGLAAVNTVLKYPTRFDSIVMDFQMPEMDGLMATETLRENNYTGRIIAVTGFGTESL